MELIWISPRIYCDTPAEMSLHHALEDALGKKKKDLMLLMASVDLLV